MPEGPGKAREVGADASRARALALARRGGRCPGRGPPDSDASSSPPKNLDPGFSPGLRFLVGRQSERRSESDSNAGCRARVRDRFARLPQEAGPAPIRRALPGRSAAIRATSALAEVSPDERRDRALALSRTPEASREASGVPPQVTALVKGLHDSQS